MSSALPSYQILLTRRSTRPFFSDIRIWRNTFGTSPQPLILQNTTRSVTWIVRRTNRGPGRRACPMVFSLCSPSSHPPETLETPFGSSATWSPYSRLGYRCKRIKYENNVQRKMRKSLAVYCERRSPDGQCGLKDNLNRTVAGKTNNLNIPLRWITAYPHTIIVRWHHSWYQIQLVAWSKGSKTLYRTLLKRPRPKRELWCSHKFSPPKLSSHLEETRPCHVIGCPSLGDQRYFRGYIGTICSEFFVHLFRCCLRWLGTQSRNLSRLQVLKWCCFMIPRPWRGHIR